MGPIHHRADHIASYANALRNLRVGKTRRNEALDLAIPLEIVLMPTLGSQLACSLPGLFPSAFGMLTARRQRLHVIGTDELRDDLPNPFPRDSKQASDLIQRLALRVDSKDQRVPLGAQRAQHSAARPGLRALSRSKFLSDGSCEIQFWSVRHNDLRMNGLDDLPSRASRQSSHRPLSPWQPHGLAPEAGQGPGARPAAARRASVLEAAPASGTLAPGRKGTPPLSSAHPGESRDPS